MPLLGSLRRGGWDRRGVGGKGGQRTLLALCLRGQDHRRGSGGFVCILGKCSALREQSLKGRCHRVLGVRMGRERGAEDPARPDYGAKITGGGSGGFVCILRRCAHVPGRVLKRPAWPTNMLPLLASSQINLTLISSPPPPTCACLHSRCQYRG